MFSDSSIICICMSSSCLSTAVFMVNMVLVTSKCVGFGSSLITFCVKMREYLDVVTDGAVLVVGQSDLREDRIEFPQGHSEVPGVITHRNILLIKILAFIKRMPNLSS